MNDKPIANAISNGFNRIFCVARNYRLHAAEMQAAVPKEPTFFMKPLSALVPVGVTIPYPTVTTQLEYEAELVVLIGKSGKPQTLDDAQNYIAGLSLGIDLTLRDKQAKLKEKGLPWEMAKSFDASAPIGDFVQWSADLPLTNMLFTCHVNHELRQSGDSADMVFSIPQLIVHLATLWTLQPGDLIYTGTPAGVGPLQRGDLISLASDKIGSFSWSVET